MAFQPAIDEPSNMMPSVSRSSSIVRDVLGGVLPLAARVGEAKVHELDVVLLIMSQNGFECPTYLGSLSLEIKVLVFVQALEPLDGFGAAFARANADGLVDCRDENFAVPDAAGAGGFLDGLDGPFDLIVFENNLDLHLGQKVDDIFGAAIELSVAFLATETLGFDDGNALEARLRAGPPSLRRA